LKELPCGNPRIPSTANGFWSLRNSFNQRQPGHQDLCIPARWPTGLQTATVSVIYAARMMLKNRTIQTAARSQYCVAFCIAES
jgi:hypothetical protein